DSCAHKTLLAVAVRIVAKPSITTLSGRASEIGANSIGKYAESAVAAWRIVVAVDSVAGIARESMQLAKIRRELVVLVDITADRLLDLPKVVRLYLVARCVAVCPSWKNEC